MGFIYPCQEYISVKILISRNIYKKLPSNVTTTFNDIPNETEYYKTGRNEDFIIFKNSDLIIFQSPFQAKLFREYLWIYKDINTSIYYMLWWCFIKNFFFGGMGH